MSTRGGLVHEASRRAGDDLRDEWRTPPWLFEKLGVQFELDPCAPVEGFYAVPAKRRYTKVDDGLARPWAGLVFINPPYGYATPTWLAKMARHAQGLALVFARTDTRWFHDTVITTTGVAFLKGRMRFHRPTGEVAGTPGVGVMLLAWGVEAMEAASRVPRALLWWPRRASLVRSTLL